MFCNDLQVLNLDTYTYCARNINRYLYFFTDPIVQMHVYIDSIFVVWTYCSSWYASRVIDSCMNMWSWWLECVNRMVTCLRGKYHWCKFKVCWTSVPYSGLLLRVQVDCKNFNNDNLDEFDWASIGIGINSHELSLLRGFHYFLNWAGCGRTPGFLKFFHEKCVFQMNVLLGWLFY